MGPDSEDMRRRSPNRESDRKRHRSDISSPDRISRPAQTNDKPWDAEAYNNSRRISSQHVPGKRTPPYGSMYHSSYGRNQDSSRGYENGFTQPVNGGASNVTPMYMQRPVPIAHAAQQQTTKSRRLYIGNVPYHAGLTDVALTQFFSALYVAGFRPNKTGEPLPVVSFWLHADGKFGFMELRGEQETVNMMQFNGIFLHGRPLRVNRPSDYKPEIHNPNGLTLVPDEINVRAVMELCEKLGPIVAAPAQLAAIAASQPPSKESIPIQETPRPFPDGIASNGDSDTHRTKNNTASEDENPTRKSSTNEDEETKLDHGSHNDSDDKNPEATVLALKDLISDNDLQADEEEFQELKEDIETVCGDIAKVESVHIAKSGSMKKTAFVQFETKEGASKAKESLSTVKFDGRDIVAISVPGCKTAKEAAEKTEKNPLTV